MSMIQLTGQLINTFKAPRRKNADEGEEEKDKLQILGEVLLTNGETKHELITITVKDSDKYIDKLNTRITLPVGAFAPQKGSVIFFVTAG